MLPLLSLTVSCFVLKANVGSGLSFQLSPDRTCSIKPMFHQAHEDGAATVCTEAVHVLSCLSLLLCTLHQ